MKVTLTTHRWPGSNCPMQEVDGTNSPFEDVRLEIVIGWFCRRVRRLCRVIFPDLRSTIAPNRTTSVAERTSRGETSSAAGTLDPICGRAAIGDCPAYAAVVAKRVARVARSAAITPRQLRLDWKLISPLVAAPFRVRGWRAAFATKCSSSAALSVGERVSCRIQFIFCLQVVSLWGLL